MRRQRVVIEAGGQTLYTSPLSRRARCGRESSPVVPRPDLLLGPERGSATRLVGAGAWPRATYARQIDGVTSTMSATRSTPISRRNRCLIVGGHRCHLGQSQTTQRRDARSTAASCTEFDATPPRVSASISSRSRRTFGSASPSRKAPPLTSAPLRIQLSTAGRPAGMGSRLGPIAELAEQVPTRDD